MPEKVKIICKHCGDEGISATELKLTGGNLYTKQSKFCIFCNKYNIFNEHSNFSADFAWSVWKEAGLTNKYVYKKKLSDLLSITYKSKNCLAKSYIFSLDQIKEICLSKKPITIKNLEYFEKKFKNESKEKNILEETANQNFKDSKDSTNQTTNLVFKGISLIPDGIFGIIVYVLIILFFIWILGDFGGECGVDYAPRFFGEC